MHIDIYGRSLTSKQIAATQKPLIIYILYRRFYIGITKIILIMLAL